MVLIAYLCGRIKDTEQDALCRMRSYLMSLPIQFMFDEIRKQIS